MMMSRVGLMGVHNIASDKVPHCSAGDNVGWKMLASANPRCTHHRGQTVRHDGNKLSIAVLMGDDGSHRPDLCRVTGRETRTTLKEVPGFAGIIGAIASGGELQ